jgi:gliding motility-associated-like protein
MQRQRITFLVFIFLLLTAYCNAQSYWMEQGGGITIDEAADVSVDAAGNTYATGYFTANAAFGTNNLSSSGTTDIYLAKIDVTGQYVWVVKAGGAGSDRPFSIKTDAAGNSYITGFFYGNATFGSQSITSAGAQDVFIAKYDNAGNCLWAKSAGSTGPDIGNGITVDNAGNVIVTGEFSGSATFGSTVLTSMGGSVDVFTTKLDGSGNFLWAKKGSAPQTDRGIDVGADAAGNIYVTGQFSDTITFDVTHNNNMFNAVFLIKYNAAGAEQWFRVIGGAGQSIANALAVGSDDNPVLAGDFLGTLTFFAAPGNTTLTAPYTNRIFVAKYDGAGNKLWASSSSSSDVLTARNVALDVSNNPFVIGDFKCKLNDYADAYGQGVFKSVGYRDIYISKWSSGGSWLWARQVGGHKDDYGMGIALNPTAEVIFTGSFNEDVIVPDRNVMLGYNLLNPPPLCLNSAPSTYCTDPYYVKYDGFTTAGNSDIIISKTIDPLRQPYDFYYRTGFNCNRDETEICIYANGNCADTAEFCQQGTLSVNPNTCPATAPRNTYLWSNGTPSSVISVSTPGIYSVIQTSEDGCFADSDTIVVIIHPLPVQPTVSDNVIVNTNSTVPQDISLCQPASPILTGGNYGSNTYEWTSSVGPSSPTLSITVTQTGVYCFVVTDTNGCSNQTCINVLLYDTLPAFNPKLICLDDGDGNDTVELCANACFEMLIYDSITNPGAAPLCFQVPYPYDVTPTWTVAPPIPQSAACNSRELFCPSDTGWYNINLMFVRHNICDTDTFYLSKSIYVLLNPTPTISLSVNPTNVLICPGDSVLLVATSSSSNITWDGPNVSGYNNDSLWATAPGSYTVTATETNSFGCSASLVAGAAVQAKPQPAITASPASALICPTDSVMLTCLDPGTYQWQGPGGPIAGNVNSIYVTQPGNYYCIVTDADGCPLVSNTIIVYVYSTPYLTPPKDTICLGDSVIISAVAGPGSTITWLPPLSGNSPTQTITTSGTYSCQILSCGITTTVSTTIMVSVPVAQIASPGPVFCQGDSVTLTANSGMTSYLWSPGLTTAQTYVATQAGTYSLVTTDNLNCSASDAITLFSYPNTTVEPDGTDTSVCSGQTTTLTATGTGNINWYSGQSTSGHLSTGNTYTPSPLTATTTFYIATTDSVCHSRFVPVTVSVNECDDSIPNVFTPNGDGLNDAFILPLLYHPCFKAKIYNRWGNLINELSDPLKGWNGKTKFGALASDGTYYYIVTYCDSSKKMHTLHGYVELIR